MFAVVVDLSSATNEPHTKKLNTDSGFSARFEIVFVTGQDFSVNLKFISSKLSFFCRWTVKHFFNPR